MKDYEHRLLERRNRTFNGHVHHLEKPLEVFKQDQDSDNFLADQVVDACLVEFNMLETPQKTTSWYLDSRATHHVSGDSYVFSSIHPTRGAHVRFAGGQNHSVARVGNVDVQVLSGEIKTISSVLYMPRITKNLLSVGSLADQHKTLVFKLEGCFVIDNTTLRLEAFAPRKNNKGLYRLQGDSPDLGPEINSLSTHRMSSGIRGLDTFIQEACNA